MKKHRSERDYIDRTIGTVRIHAEADNSWPQWANILSDEIEDLRADLEEAAEIMHDAMEEFGYELDDVSGGIGPGDSESLARVDEFLGHYMPIGCRYRDYDSDMQRLGVCQLRYGHDGEHAIVWVKREAQ